MDEGRDTGFGGLGRHFGGFARRKVRREGSDGEVDGWMVQLVGRVSRGEMIEELYWWLEIEG